MPVEKTRKENPFLPQRKAKKPRKKAEEQLTDVRPVPSIVPPKWHPVERKGESLNSRYAEAMAEDLHLEFYEMNGFELATSRVDPHTGGYEVTKTELDQMRKVAFS